MYRWYVSLRIEKTGQVFGMVVWADNKLQAEIKAMKMYPGTVFVDAEKMDE